MAAPPTLPMDLIMVDIIPRLPMKAIGRFRCVSKPWRSLLSTREFLKSHLELHANDRENLIYTAWHNDDFHAIDFSRRGGNGNDGGSKMVLHLNDYKRRVPQLGASCHGLVFLLMKGLQTHRKVLFNPVTRAAVELPPGPKASTCTYGLGYDDVRDDYKVVSLSLEGPVHVYSVRRRAWKRLADLRFDFSSIPGVFLDGCIYWMAYGNKPGVHKLIAFNLASEEFEELSLPSEFDGELGFGIAVLEGFLAVWFVSGLDLIDIWVMKDSWTNVVVIDCPMWLSDRVDERFSVVCLLNEAEFVLNWCDSILYAYNWKSEHWRRLNIDGLPL